MHPPGPLGTDDNAISLLCLVSWIISLVLLARIFFLNRPFDQGKELLSKHMNVHKNGFGRTQLNSELSLAPLTGIKSKNKEFIIKYRHAKTCCVVMEPL